MAALDGEPLGALSLPGRPIEPLDLSSASAPARTDRRGAIVLARHGEPALSRRVRLDSDGYRAWWARYELGGLLEGQTPPEGLKAIARDAHAIFCSIRPRAIETARAVAGDRPVVQDARFIEAPLPPPRFPSWLRFNPRLWGVISRFWWWTFDHHEGQESKAEALARAEAAAHSLIEIAEGGRDVLVLAHGYFNLLMGHALKRAGWRCVKDEGFKYWSARRFEKR